MTFAELQERLAAATSVRDWHNAFAEWEAESDPDDAHEQRMAARDARAELFRRTPEGRCEDCLKPIPPSWSYCNNCEDRWDYERRENER